MLNLVDKQQIKLLCKSGVHDCYIKKLDGYSHFVIMLYSVLMRHDSLREIKLGMLLEVHKFQHIGIDYIVKHSTLAEAHQRRDSYFFARIYFSIYHKHKGFLADSRTHKDWEHLLPIMDSTTISLFSSVLKGVGRNPKHGKKKVGVKVHTVIRPLEYLLYSIHFTSAATHDHILLRKLKLSNGAFLAMDRAYIDYKVFEQFTKEGVFYVTKMKKNQRFIQQDSCYLINENGLVVLHDAEVAFSKDNIK